MATLISHNLEQTMAAGEKLGAEAQRGWVIGLTGDLGAGKTQLVKGIARGLGSKARVHSPTFALLNEYADGRLRLYHIDLYRLNSRDEVMAAGLDEYLAQPDGVAVVEWVERWVGQIPAGAVQAPARSIGLARIVEIEIVSPEERRITIRD